MPANGLRPAGIPGRPEHPLGDGSSLRRPSYECDTVTAYRTTSEYFSFDSPLLFDWR